MSTKSLNFYFLFFLKSVCQNCQNNNYQVIPPKFGLLPSCEYVYSRFCLWSCICGFFFLNEIFVVICTLV